MSTRILYFIRDSVTGKYYTSRGNYQVGDFSNAVIHTTENSVKSGVSTRCTMWRRDAKEPIHPIKKNDDFDYTWTNRHTRAAIKRSKLKNFGMEVVTVTINDKEN